MAHFPPYGQNEGAKNQAYREMDLGKIMGCWLNWLNFFISMEQYKEREIKNAGPSKGRCCYRIRRKIKGLQLFSNIFQCRINNQISQDSILSNVLFYGFGNHWIKGVCSCKLSSVQESIQFKAPQKTQTDQGPGWDIFVKAIIGGDMEITWVH